MATSVKAFVYDAYSLINASHPTTPLQQSDFTNGLRYLNRLLESYSGTALMLTIAAEQDVLINIGQQFVTFAAPNYIPTADVPFGRLANLENAWLTLNGVTYPLNIANRNDFQAAWKYDPLQGLPRFVVFYPQVDVTSLRIYPAPSQQYLLHIYGKYELSSFGPNDTIGSLPNYYELFLLFSLAKQIAMFQGRMEAWTEKLEGMLMKYEADMMSVSSVNLKINDDYDDFLNGSYRVQAGI